MVRRKSINDIIKQKQTLLRYARINHPSFSGIIEIISERYIVNIKQSAAFIRTKIKKSKREPEWVTIESLDGCEEAQSLKLHQQIYTGQYHQLQCRRSE